MAVVMTGRQPISTPFAAPQAAAQAPMDMADGDDKFLDAFARELMQGQPSLDGDLFRGLPTPDFNYAASGQDAASQAPPQHAPPPYAQSVGFINPPLSGGPMSFDVFAAQLDSYAEDLPRVGYAPQALAPAPSFQQLQQQAAQAATPYQHMWNAHQPMRPLQEMPQIPQLQHLQGYQQQQQQQQPQQQRYQPQQQQQQQQQQPYQQQAPYPYMQQMQQHWEQGTLASSSATMTRADFGASEPPLVVSQPIQRTNTGSTSNSDEAPGLASHGSGLGSRSLRKTNSSGSTGSGDMRLHGVVKKEHDNGSDKLAKQLDRFKEKNRTAQKRYRERQKSKLTESEDRVAELTEQLNLLRTEKETLATRNALLEKFLAMQQQQAQAGSTSIVEGEKDAWWLDERTKRLIEQTLRLSGTLTFSVREGAPLHLTRQQVADLPFEEFNALWKEYINGYAECLLKANGDPESPAGKRLAQLVYEAGQLKGSIAMTFPDRIHSLQARAMPSCGPLEPNTPESLREMIRTIALSDAQVKVLVALRKLYLQNLSVLVRRRKQLSAALQAAMPLGDKQQQVADVYLRTVATMDRLRESLRDEHSFLMQFMLTVWRRVFTPFQVAQLSIQAYPHSADMLAMINCLAEDLGELPAPEMLSQGAASGETALVPIDAAAAMLPPDEGLQQGFGDALGTAALPPLAAPGPLQASAS